MDIYGLIGKFDGVKQINFIIYNSLEDVSWLMGFCEFGPDLCKNGPRYLYFLGPIFIVLL